MAAPLLVLVHSPLVGPFTWSAVAAALRRRGIDAVVPVLRDRGESAGPYWWQHAMSAAAMLAALPAGGQIVLVGHSGAGPLLPAVRRVSERSVAAYLFVDAGILHDDASRLGLLRFELPGLADQLQAHLEAGGCFPEWRDEDLRDVLPDAAVRRKMLQEMQPRGLPFWQEPLPVFDGWPDAPCAYLQFSDGYAVPAEQARADGWAYRRLDAGHFHMLVDPEAVTTMMLDLLTAMGMMLPRGRAR